MIFRTVGTFLKKSFSSKGQWPKFSIAIVLSNIFFFTLFSPSDSSPPPAESREGLVEVQIRAEAMTPFQSGKKIILLNRKSKLRLEGVLQEDMNNEGKYSLWVKEAQASLLFHHTNWEIFPYLKDLIFPVAHKGEHHEIRY